MRLYLLSVHYVEGQPLPPPETIEAMHAGVMAFNEELREAGAWVFAGGLEEPHVASVLREENGEVLTTDGPFPEAKEHIGGFWVVKVDDEEAALAWAAKATHACQGPVEVRPFQEDVTP